MNAPQAKPWIEAIAPYVPGRSTTDDGRKVAKLSSNENPFGTPEAAAAAYVRESGTLHRYPDASAAALREALAAKYGLDPARVIYGTGSDEILHLRSEEHTSELQSLMRTSYAVFCLKHKNRTLPMISSPLIQ